MLDDLAALPGVARVGIALTEGGGRRLRFLSSDGVPTDRLVWCHIDAYDDVPLTTVVRTGQPVLGDLESFEGRFAGLIERQRRDGIRALAALPLPGAASAIGGILVYFDRPQEFTQPQRRLLESAARRTAEAVRRVRAAAGFGGRGAKATAASAAETTRSARLRLDNEPQAAGEARHFLRDLLAKWDVRGEVPDTAQLCLSELVTNAIIHTDAGSELTVTLEREVLTVVVRDLGGEGWRGAHDPVAAASEDADPLRVFGRGLVLVDALADRWGSDRDATGTTSWFALDLARHAALAG